MRHKVRSFVHGKKGTRAASPRNPEQIKIPSIINCDTFPAI